MKNSLLSLLTLSLAPVLCAPVWAQPAFDPLPYPLVTPAEAIRQTQGAPIVLKLNNVTLYQALKQLQAQSGVEFDYSSNIAPGSLSKTLSLDLETTAFSEAFDAILEAAGVNGRLLRYGTRELWHLELGQPGQERGALRSGIAPLELRLTSLDTTLSKNVNLADPKNPARSDKDALQVSLQTPSNPQLDLVMAPRLRVTRAVDEAGRSLVDAKTQKRQSLLASFARQPSLSLLPPAQDARTIAHLEGVATYVLPTARERWEVPNALEAKDVTHEFQSNGKTLRATLQSVTREGESFELKFQIVLPLEQNRFGPRNATFNSDYLLSSLRLEDANGKILRSGSAGVRGSGDADGNTLIATVRFVAPTNVALFETRNGQLVRNETLENQALALPLKFVLDAPKDFVQTEVPFSNENVPLP